LIVILCLSDTNSVSEGVSETFKTWFGSILSSNVIAYFCLEQFGSDTKLAYF